MLSPPRGPQPIPLLGKPPYRVEHITQPVDHLNGLTSNATFLQRYLREDSNFTKGGPIFAFTGGEGGDVPLYWGSYAAPIGLARRLGGMIIFMEMRFEGSSNVFNVSSHCAGGISELCATADRLGLLSIEQVLADYTRLLTSVVNQCGTACATSPVVTFGGSLAGTLATMMRLHAPWLVDLVWASSSPLLGWDGIPGIDQFSWRQRITTNWHDLGSASCVDAVRAGFRALQFAKDSTVSKAFNVCKDEDSTAGDARAAGGVIAARVQGAVWSELEGDGLWVYPPADSTIPKRCTAMLSAKGDGLEGFARLMQVGSPPGKCLNVTPTPPSRKDLVWDYLACLQILHPIGSNNVTDFFPPGRWSVQEITQQCRAQFSPMLTPRAHALPARFGLYDLPRFVRSASHVLFTYGSRDPWATLGVGKTNLSATLPVLVIPNGSHCADMGPDRPTDTPVMLAARQRAYGILGEWVHARRQQKAADLLVESDCESDAVRTCDSV